MDSLTITIIFIALSTVVGAFVKGRIKDKCLLDFEDDLTHIELKDEKTVWGVLRLEATGLELQYKEPYLDKQDNNIETSYILYKNEFSRIQCVTRFIANLDDKGKKKRVLILDDICSQKGLIRMRRRIRNIFATVRDSIMEIVNLLIGRAKQMSPAQNVLSNQDKYVSRIQTDMFFALNTSFEPLLEKRIGRRVILQLARKDVLVEYAGILKGYTAEFLELMDVSYRCSDKEEARKADIIVPRSLGLIRHLGGE